MCALWDTSEQLIRTATEEFLIYRSTGHRARRRTPGICGDCGSVVSWEVLVLGVLRWWHEVRCFFLQFFQRIKNWVWLIVTVLIIEHHQQKNSKVTGRHWWRGSFRRCKHKVLLRLFECTKYLGGNLANTPWHIWFRFVWKPWKLWRSNDWFETLKNWSRCRCFLQMLALSAVKSQCPLRTLNHQDSYGWTSMASNILTAGFWSW